MSDMNLKEAKESLLKPVHTPSGQLTLYGINCVPETEDFALYFYVGGKRKMYWNIDCMAVEEES